jgi:hypothetical protein
MGTALGIGISPIFGSGVSFEAETQALFARFTTPPTSARASLIDNLIKALKYPSTGTSLLTKLDALYVMAAETAQAAQRNWIANLYNLTPTNAPTFTADRGYQGNGTSSYLATGFTPSSAPSPKLVQNSASLGVWSRTNSAADVTDLGAKGSGTQDCTILIRTAGGLFLNRVDVSAGNGNNPANSSSLGLFVGVRSDANTLSNYANGSLLTSGTVASNVVSTLAFNIGARNDNGTFGSYSTRQYAAAFYGASLTAAEVLVMYNALNSYLTAIGAA